MKILQPSAVDELYESVERNLPLYTEGNFEGIFARLGDKVPELKIVDVDVERLSRLRAEGKAEGALDAENALHVYESLEHLPPRHARNEGIWAYLTHGPCLPYARGRWLRGKEGDDLVSKIKAHFFARGREAFIRNNAVSSLWWWAHIASRYPRDKAPLEKTLKVLLTRTDIRLNVVERSTMARASRTFCAIVDVLMSKYDESPNHPFLVKEDVYRDWTKRIIMHGGVRLLEAMPEEKLGALIRKLADDAEKVVEDKKKAEAKAP